MTFTPPEHPGQHTFYLCGRSTISHALAPHSAHEVLPPTARTSSNLFLDLRVDLVSFSERPMLTPDVSSKLKFTTTYSTLRRLEEANGGLSSRGTAPRARAPVAVSDRLVIFSYLCC